MSPEFWAILGVTAIILEWSMYARLAGVEKGQACIKGWIARRFRKENIQS